MLDIRGLNLCFQTLTLACKMKLESCGDAVRASYRWDINSSPGAAELALGQRVGYKGGALCKRQHVARGETTDALHLRETGGLLHCWGGGGVAPPPASYIVSVTIKLPSLEFQGLSVCPRSGRDT